MRRQDVQEPCCRDKEQCSVSREHLGRYRDACALCAVVALIALASGGIWNTTAIGPTPSSTSSASSVSAESDGLQGEQEDSASEKALFKAKRQRRGKIKFRTHRDDQRRRRKKSGSKKGGRPTSRPPQVADYNSLVLSGWKSGSARIADGCQHVYLDMGSNVGIQVRKLYRPERFPGAGVIPIFSKFFPNVTQRRETVCAIGMEPNPKHAERLRRLARLYTNVGWRTAFVEAAASNHAATAGFVAPHPANELQQAARVTNRHPNATQVKTIDISDFIIKQILSRQIPQKNKPHFVVAKMDIEGMEHRVIPEMWRTGAACGIDVIMLEWHGKERLPLNCTWWIEMDDEKYGRIEDEDEASLPQPQNSTSNASTTINATTTTTTTNTMRSSLRASTMRPAVVPTAVRSNVTNAALRQKLGASRGAGLHWESMGRERNGAKVRGRGIPSKPP
jgi:FkbM family methyltransferase